MMHARVVPSIDIENLLQWAYQTERAGHDHPISGGVSAFSGSLGYSQDSTIRCEKVSLAGGFVQGTSPGASHVANDTASDALTVAAHVSELAPITRALVVKHARTGTRPDWKPGARHRFEPEVIDGNGMGETQDCVHLGFGLTRWKPGRIWDRNRKRSVPRARPRWVRVVEADGPAQVAAYRMDYLRWHSGLRQLRRSLAPALCDLSLADLLPEQEPWV